MIASISKYPAKSNDEQPIHVLLVEDTEATRQLILDVFEHSIIGTYRLTPVIRLTDAQNYLRQSSDVDIIILDLDLPDSSGLETLSGIMSVVDTIPVIVLTGNDDRALGRKAINLGAQDFIVKGYGAEGLLPRVAYYTIERHRAHLQAIRSELFLRASMDSLPSRIAIIDTDHTILFLNKAWTGQHQNDSDDRLPHPKEGDNYFITCLPRICQDATSIDRMKEGVQNILHGSTNYFETEYQHLTRNGERWYQVSITPLLDADRNSVVIVHENITGRKRIEVDLFRSREYLRVIFDTTPNLVFVKDDQGHFIMANKAVGRMFGLEPSQLIGKKDFELFRERGLNQEECRTFAMQDRQVLQTHTPLTIELGTWTDHQDIRHWFRTTKMPIQLPHCQPYILTIAIDITETRNSQEKNRASETLLRTILDAIQHRILLLNDKMEIIWANKAAVDCAGNPLPEIGGKNCMDIFHPVNDHLACPAELAMKTGEIHFSEIRRDDGNTTLEVSTIPIKDNSGKVENVVCIAEDISQRLSFEKQLRQAQKMESLGVLAGGIAHDFNNILTAVLGFTELALYKVKDDSSLTGDLKEVYQASIRARELVNQILTFSRRIDKQLKPLDISLMVKEALKLLRSTLPTSIHIDFHLDKDLGLVLADPTQIHQIVMNLATNAAHAMQKNGGTLTISLRSHFLDAEQIQAFHDIQPGQYIAFSVADTGHGIGNDILPYIFDPYFTTKGLGEGTGLGLSVVHGIIKEYGGDIQVKSVIGEGTSFTLLFPVTVEEPTISKPLQPLEKRKNHTGYTILVLDDEPSIVKLCKRLLESSGYQVHAETDPRVALRHILNGPHRFDLLLSDLTMPHLTGDKLAEAVHQTLPRFPVILMTGNKEKLESLAATSRFTACIDKPIDNGKLFEMMDKMLAVSQHN